MSKGSNSISRGRKAHGTRNGATDIGVVDASPEARFGAKVKPLPSGCWQYGSDLHSYGTMNYSRRNGMPHAAVPAHRYAYETLVGPIPDGHHLHHTCEHPGCVNPAHLVPLTPGDHAAEHARLRAAS